MNELNLDSHPDHLALRAMRERFVAAYNRLDVEGMLAEVDENVTFTAMNGECVYGHEGVRDYYERMLQGPKASVKSTSVDAIEAERYSTIYGGQFAVAGGWADTSYLLSDGLKFSCRIRWTNCMAKIDGQWKIVSFHTSSNIFDNPILSMTKKASKVVAAGAAAGAAVVGVALGWFLRRR